jgi:predicted permease
MIGELFRRVRYWLAGDTTYSELDEEMRLHIAMRAEKLRASGLPPEQALREARRRFGNQPHLRERSRDMWIGEWLDDVARDVRVALRALARRPGFTAAAVLTLAVGIGANTAVFSVLNSVLLRPLAYPDAERLVSVSNKAPGAHGLTSASGDLQLSPSMYFTFADENRTLEAMGVWSPGTANVTSFAEPEQVPSVSVSDGTLRALGVQPMLGPGLASADYKPGGPPRILISHGYWQRRFGGDRSVVGRIMRVDLRSREIVGVMPAGFRVVNAAADIISPMRFNRADLRLPGFGLQGVGRLKQGVDLSAANADLGRLIPVWMRSWPTLPGVDPKVYESWQLRPDLRPLRQEVVGNIGELLWIVMATIGVVMLIAGANVAGLLLVRMESRQQELATRSALGAGKWRIVGELLIESTLLGAIGGVIGCAGAIAAVQYLVTAGPAMLPRLSEITVDGRALWFTFALSLGGGVLAGLIPAMRYARPPLAASIRGAGRSVSGGGTRNGLVIGQVALAAVLLVSAGLMFRTFRALQDVAPGFADPERIQTARISVPGTADQMLRAQSDILGNLRSIPGVESAAFISELPMDGLTPNWDAICVEGQGLRGGEIPPVRTYKSISPGFFQTMGTRIIAGRDLTWTEVLERRPFVVLSENLAQELFGGAQGALGKRISACVPNSRLHEVAGVVQDVRDKGVDKPAPATVYWPPVVEDMYGPGDRSQAQRIALVMRTRVGGERLPQQMSQAVWAVNKGIPLASIQTMRAVVDRSMASTSFALVMLGIAGTMALFLGVIGIYGVISYAVSQRRREMGIRLALGARPRSLQVRFVRQSLVMAGMGVVFGIVASAGLMRLMGSLLFGTSPFDPLTYLAVAGVLMMAAGLASYLPARRAAAVDPGEVLRAEG